MLLKILLGIRQTLLGYDTKHETDFSWFATGLGSPRDKSFISFPSSLLPLIHILRGTRPAKVSHAHKMCCCRRLVGFENAPAVGSIPPLSRPSRNDARASDARPVNKDSSFSWLTVCPKTDGCMRLPAHAAPLSFASQETISRQFRHFHQHGRISGGRSASLAQNDKNFGPDFPRMTATPSPSLSAKGRQVCRQFFGFIFPASSWFGFFGCQSWHDFRLRWRL